MTASDNEIVIPRLILASGSPRRRQLLHAMGIRSRVIVPHIPEKRKKGEAIVPFAKRLALEKALAVSRRIKPVKTPAYILGADTVVVLDGKVIGKPQNREDARRFLEKLSGRTHRVITAYAIARWPAKISVCRAAVSKVTMKKMTRRDIIAYVETGEPMDKAGAYAAQGRGRRLIEKIEGSVTNVIGLPAEELMPWFRRLGLLQHGSTSSPCPPRTP